jgi:hypothetical protein
MDIKIVIQVSASALEFSVVDLEVRSGLYMLCVLNE